MYLVVYVFVETITAGPLTSPSVLVLICCVIFRALLLQIALLCK